MITAEISSDASHYSNFDLLYQKLIPTDNRKPAGEQFIQHLSEHTETLERLVQDNVTNRDLLDEMISNGAPSGKLIEFNSRATNLIREEEVDPLTAKLFLASLANMKAISGHMYNQITKPSQEVDSDFRDRSHDFTIAREKFDEQIGQIGEPQDSSLFRGYNFDKNKSPINRRVYISLDYLNDDSPKSLEYFANALGANKAYDNLRFKISDGLNRRFEQVVIYYNHPSESEVVQSTLQEFLHTCPEELLQEEPMPSAVKLARGVHIAPELDDLHQIIEDLGNKGVSFNEFTAALVELAFRRAYWDHQEENPTPKLLKPKATEYFEQMMRLAGIDLTQLESELDI